MEKIKIKLNKKLLDATYVFIEEKFGKIINHKQLNIFNFPFEVCFIGPTPEHPYSMLITVGLQMLKFPHYGKNIEGVELFIKLPQSWNFTDSDDYYEGWVWNVFAGIASSLLKGETMVPGSTYNFGKIANESTQEAVIVHYSFLGPDNTILDIKKKSIIFLEIQTLYSNEWESLLKSEEIVDELYSLPCVDLKRKNLLNE